MPVLRKIAKFADTLGEFALALWHHWVGFVSGSVVMAIALALYERFAHPIPNFYYLGMLFIGFIVAAYLAWLEEYDKRTDAEADIAARGETPNVVEWADTQIERDFQTETVDDDEYIVAEERRGYVSVIVTTHVTEDLKLRVDFVIPPVSGIRLPLYVYPEKREARFYLGERVHFPVATTGDDPLRLWIGGAELPHNSVETYMLICSCVGTGGTPKWGAIFVSTEDNELTVSVTSDFSSLASLARA